MAERQHWGRARIRALGILTAGAGSLLFAASAMAAAGDFSSPVSSPEAVGSGPWSVAVGDFNRDGNPDQAVPNANANNVSILLGDGAGDFTATGSPEAVGTFPIGVAVGDFNGNGKQDLAVANYGSDNVTILLGDGTGDFTAAGTEAVGTQPWSVSVADFDGNGDQDLAVANNTTDNVTILIGDGTGNFSAAASSPEGAGDEPRAVATGDLNGDGSQDVAVANGGSSNVTILLGDGAGDFTAASTSPETVGFGPSAIVVGDFNRDGKRDLATANSGGSVTILTGDGTGNFTASTVFTGVTGAIAVADFDANGTQDLAVADLNLDAIEILLGDGSGGFTGAATSPEPAGSAPRGLAVADFDRNGRPDIAAANRDSSNVTVLLNQSPVSPSADFAPAATSPEAAGNGPRAVAVADFNGDGNLDQAVANGAGDNVSILLGDGMGNFTAAGSSPEAVGDIPVAVAAGDFNADGKQDLAVANFGTGDNVSILLGTGSSGDFTSFATVAAGTDPWSVAVGDFDGNGDQDLAVANGGSNDVTILLGNGTGNFTAAGTGPEAVGSDPRSVAVGDFDADGKQDLAVANNGPDNVSILLGDGTGNFAAPGTETVGTNPTAVAVGNFDADGRQDLAVANNGSNNVTILLGQGDGNFTAAGTSPEATGTNPVAIAVGNFEANGRQDLAVVNGVTDDVTILAGQGAGNFNAADTSPEAVGDNPQGFAIGDFDADGKPDLAVANFNTDNVTILLGRPDLDGDGVVDEVDSCASGAQTGTDTDTDGCKDAGEDSDDDDDTKADGSDSCPAGNTGWTSNGTTDYDQDGCRDAGEDTDDDDDTVLDGSDDCPAGVTGAGSDPDGDGCKNAEDPDDDNDTLLDGSDRCDVIAGPTPSGCPAVGRTLTMSYSAARHKFKGALSAPATPACAQGQPVKIRRKKRGPDAKVGTATTRPNGSYALSPGGLDPGRYYAISQAKVIDDLAACGEARSAARTIG